MIEPSGPQWVERFPGSTSLDDLDPEWRPHATAFISMLRASGPTVTIGSTYRPPERAYLMHFACMVAGYTRPDGSWYQLQPNQIPFRGGVDIDWTHKGDVEAARAAAKAMVLGYGIVYPAALVSRHTQRLAVDMHVSWTGTLTVVDATGAIHTIADGPRNGTNPKLAVVGATYGVVKNPTDAPHWSKDGR